jgi:hypothetical protein
VFIGMSAHTYISICVSKKIDWTLKKIGRGDTKSMQVSMRGLSNQQKM